MDFARYVKFRLVKMVSLFSSLISLVTIVGYTYRLSDGVWQISDSVITFLKYSIPLESPGIIAFLIFVFVFAIMLYLLVDYSEKVMILKDVLES